MANRITLNIPHASTNGLASTAWNDPQMLTQCVNELTDWHTDLMFTPDRGRFAAHAVLPHVFPFSRFVVDAERLINDPMEEIGQGIVYTDFYGRMYRNVSQEEKDNLYKERAEYLSKIKQTIISNDRQGYGNILIDCHSFPSCRSQVDICIGYNDDASKPSDDLMDIILKTFRDSSLTIGINTPFSNALQPIDDLTLLHHSYCSFMIELNKKIYLDETTHALLPSAATIRAVIEELYTALLEA